LTQTTPLVPVVLTRELRPLLKSTDHALGAPAAAGVDVQQGFAITFGKIAVSIFGPDATE
jgi:hypothetical protein